VSVGHVARGFEEAGIPTVSVFVRAFRHVAERMALPRTLITNHPMGRPLGAAGDAQRQRLVIDAALDLLATGTSKGTMADLDQDWQPGASR
jgi:hypothetical protein